MVHNARLGDFSNIQILAERIDYDQLNPEPADLPAPARSKRKITTPDSEKKQRLRTKLFAKAGDATPLAEEIGALTIDCNAGPLAEEIYPFNLKTLG